MYGFSHKAPKPFTFYCIRKNYECQSSVSIAICGRYSFGSTAFPSFQLKIDVTAFGCIIFCRLTDISQHLTSFRRIPFCKIQFLQLSVNRSISVTQILYHRTSGFFIFLNIRYFSRCHCKHFIIDIATDHHGRIAAILL